MRFNFYSFEDLVAVDEQLWWNFIGSGLDKVLLGVFVSIFEEYSNGHETELDSIVGNTGVAVSEESRSQCADLPNC